MLQFFSNEKIFEQDQKVNKRLCKDLTHVPKVMQTKFPASVTVLGLVRIKRNAIHPHFFPRGLRVKAVVYQEMLQRVVKP